MHSGSGRLAVKQKSAVSVYVGIATLLLEGRVFGSEDDDDNFLGISQAQHHVVDEIETDRSLTPSTTRHTVINRISEKLMRLRQFPGTSKDIIETSILVPVHSRDECDYERQPRLHHVASAREFQRNPRLTSIPTSSTSNSSSAASVLHDIDVDWNDISIVLSGLDSIGNVPTFPLKLITNQNIRASSSSMPINHESMKLYKMKVQHEKLFGTSMTSQKSSSTKPKLGPHCEKFLKKIGLIKIEPSETEIEHMCAHVNGYCRRWQFHLKKLLQILSRSEDACIEVYLGPENNAILLEQWILTITDKPSLSTMTIQALCSAIRSQLYFSQISSWIDLLKKAFVEGDLSVKEQMPSLFSPEIMQNPRLKKNLQTMQVDLDILFRIKSFDGTSSFTEKPNIHNFPDTIISDGLAICVCLKSLPRLEKIPTLNTEKAHLNGFSCDNRIKSSMNVGLESPVAGSSRHLTHDRMVFPSCHEKGKHRCKDEDDEIVNDEVIEHVEEKKENLETTSPRDQSVIHDLSTSNSSVSSSGLTHRERQLLKYKKRIMKREKHKKKQMENEHCSNFNEKTVLNYSNTSDINNMEIPLYNNSSFVKNDLNGSAVMDETEKSTAIPSTTTDNNKSKHALATTLSIATQTEFNDLTALPSPSSSKMFKCDSCGNQLQCLNCDKVKLINNNNNNDNINNYNNQMASPISINATSSTLSNSNSSTSSATGTMIGKKADLLLQAIQRTAIAHKNDEIDSGVAQLSDKYFSSPKTITNTRDSNVEKASTSCDDVSLCIDTSDCDKITNSIMHDNNSISNYNSSNNNNNIAEISSINYLGNSVQLESEIDCRLCQTTYKRQKTKHTPSMNICGSNKTNNNNNNNNNGGSIYRRTMSECLVSMSPEDEDCIFKTNQGIYLSPLSSNCDDLNILNHSSQMMSEEDYNKILSNNELKAYRRAFSEDVINQLPNESSCYENNNENNNNNNKNDEDEECITFKCDHDKDGNKISQPIHKLTPNVTLQQHQQQNLSRELSLYNLINNRNQSNQRIPKINLSQIFDKIQPQQHNIQNDSGIGQDTSELIDFSPTSDNVFIFNSPIKSYPPKMQISSHPGNSLNKRRSRHLSHRSSLSMSEYASDEDEIIPSSSIDKMPIPSSTKISSLYKKFVSKTQTAFTKFSKLPMLCTMEENLLHNRFQPKSTVEGFKLLLCASGSFCPTQLTIPAQTYFYEFQGIKHMSTPYVCELRLARKYSIPRFGTVQATLLNPQGTVVRMFFVPYDFRDMPAMSQTFIRQRVLAIDEHHTSQRNVEQMSTSEQMKHLRYVINLRFQTGRSGRLCLHTDIKLIISRRTEFDTAAAHAKNSLESPNDLKTIMISPDNPKFSSRIDKS